MKETLYLLVVVIVLALIIGNVSNYFKMKGLLKKNLTETRLNWFFLHPETLCVMHLTEQFADKCETQCRICDKLACNLRNRRLIDEQIKSKQNVSKQTTSI